MNYLISRSISAGEPIDVLSFKDDKLREIIDKYNEEELAFYDLLLTKLKSFEDYHKVKEIAKRIVHILGDYVEVAEIFYNAALSNKY
ncbi:MAG: hypothetical protein ACK4GJ_06475 [bacterium]